MNDDLKRQAIFNLLDSEGWQLVESFINERIDGSKTQLISCKMEDIVVHRTKITTYNSIFRFINDIKENNVVEEDQE